MGRKQILDGTKALSLAGRTWIPRAVEDYRCGKLSASKAQHIHEQCFSGSIEGVLGVVGRLLQQVLIVVACPYDVIAIYQEDFTWFLLSGRCQRVSPSSCACVAKSFAEQLVSRELAVQPVDALIALEPTELPLGVPAGSLLYLLHG